VSWVEFSYNNSYQESLKMTLFEVRVSQSGLKTGGGATTVGARGIITEVASSGS
jgi:hypothetical protein